MITPNSSSNLFNASYYAPNPASTMYWIDLNENSRGNVIKTYDGTNWLPLNRSANTDQWQHISELVKTCGLHKNEREDTIVLPSNKDNHYFKGSSLTDTIQTGDSEVYGEITALWKKLNSVGQYVYNIEPFTSTDSTVTFNATLYAATDEEATFTKESDITLNLPTVVDNSNAGVITGEQYHGLLTKDTEQDGKISALETKVAALESSLQTLQGKVTTLESEYTALNTTVSNLQNRISQLENSGTE